MNKTDFLKLWSICMGGMDAMTGLLLLFVPLRVLALLRISPPVDDALVFINWIGVFVLGVGLSYGLPVINRTRGETVWMFTAMMRAMVAAFLTVQVMNSSMEPAWLVVAGADAMVAVAQGLMLRAGWWREVRS